MKIPSLQKILAHFGLIGHNIARAFPGITGEKMRDYIKKEFYIIVILGCWALIAFLAYKTIPLLLEALK